MPNKSTATSVLQTFELRWEDLLHHISPANADDNPRFRQVLRAVYIGAALALLSGGVSSLSPADAQRLGDLWAAEALEIMRRQILERRQKKQEGPIQ